MPSIVMQYLPALVLLAAGFVATRFGRVDRSGLGGVLHFVLIPAYLFDTLIGSGRKPIPDDKAMWIVLFGAVMAVAGILIVNGIHDKFRQRVDGSASVANIAVFALPMLSLGGVARNPNLRMAIALAFIGMALGHILFRARGKGFSIIARQPWFYAVVAAGLVRYGFIKPKLVAGVAEPLASAAIGVSLLYLGMLLTSLNGLSRKDVWVTMLARLGIGIAVALVFFKFKLVAKPLRPTLLLAAMAPPATLGLAMIASGANDDSGTDAELVGAGIFISVVAYLAFPMYSKTLLGLVT